MHGRSIPFIWLQPIETGSWLAGSWMNMRAIRNMWTKALFTPPFCMSRVGNLYMHAGRTCPYVYSTPTKYRPHDKSYPNYSRIPIINWTQAKCTLDSTTKNGLGLVWHILYSGLFKHKYPSKLGFNALRAIYIYIINGWIISS